MKRSPSIADFIVRVGTASALVLAAILFAKKFFPGKEAVASFIACCVGAMFLVFEHVAKRRRRTRGHDRRPH